MRPVTPRLRLCLAALLAFAIYLLSAPVGAADVKGEGKIAITMGVLPVIDTLPLVVGAEKGLFEEQGINVKLQYFSSALERDVALQSGKIDAYFGDLLNTLLLINSGQRLSVVTTAFRTDPKHRMFAILASPKSGITSVKQVPEAEIAISKASIIEFVLDRMLESASVAPSAARKLEMRAIPIRYQMLMADKVKLAVLPEPMAAKAESEGAKVLADDRVLGMTLTVIAFRSERLREFPDLSSRFIRGYGRAVQLINANPEAFKDLLVERTQFPPSLKASFRVPSFPLPEKPPKRDVNSTGEWLLQRKLIAREQSYENIVP